MDCRLSEEHSAGTHTLFVGEVLESGAVSGRPLGYFNAAYQDYGLEIAPEGAPS